MAGQLQTGDGRAAWCPAFGEADVSVLEWIAIAGCILLALIYWQLIAVTSQLISVNARIFQVSIDISAARDDLQTRALGIQSEVSSLAGTVSDFKNKRFPRNDDLRGW